MMTEKAEIMMKFDTNKFEKVPGQCFHYEVDAAELELHPGVFPDKFEVPGLGNDLPFYLISRSQDRNTYLYHQDFGCVDITIYNT